MNNCEIYIINLKKDYGRLLTSKSVVDIFGAKVYEAEDINRINNLGYIESCKNNSDYTQSAKLTKKKLFEIFMKTSKKRYILIFEDDIYLHNDFFTNKNAIFNQINNFINEKKPKLLYFGISHHFVATNRSTDRLSFVPFSSGFRGKNIEPCSGAYGFLLDRTAIPLIMTRINNDTFKGFAFDMSALSYVSATYPNDSYVVDPPLVVPDISNSNMRKNNDQTMLWTYLNVRPTDYKIPTIGVMFVEMTSEQKILYFNKVITCITPIVKIVYYTKYTKRELVDTFDKSNLLFTIDTTTDTKLKYYCGKNLIDSILEHKNLCSILEINNLNCSVKIMVNYLNTNTDLSIKKITIDI